MTPASSTSRKISHIRMLLVWMVLSGLAFLPACTSTEIASPAPTDPPEATAIPPVVRANPNPHYPLDYLVQPGSQVHFDHITPEDGLSQSVALDIAQDHQGFLWIATQDGLNRYDGYKFKVFKHDPQNPESLAENSLTAIEVDPTGAIWVATASQGLDRYDPKTGRFSHFTHRADAPYTLSENSTTTLLIDQRGSLWVGTASGGLNRMDPDSGKFTRFQNDPQTSNSLSDNGISGIVQDVDGSLWVGTFHGGLNHLNPQTGDVTRYMVNAQNPYSLSSNNVTSLRVDRQGNLWVGTIDAGLNRMDRDSGEFMRYRAVSQDPTSLSHDSIFALFEDRHGNFWVATNGGGINLLNRQTGRFSQIRKDPNRPESLSNDAVFSIYEDRTGILWFGTFGSGLEKYDPQKYKFAVISTISGSAGDLSPSQIWSIYEDQQGNIWIGTYDGGLNRLDPRSDQWRRYLSDPDDPKSLSSNVIFDILEDRAGIFWIATSNGLTRFNPEKEEFIRISIPLMLFCLKEDSAGSLWIGSNGGLLKMDPSTSEYLQFTHDPEDLSSISSNAIVSLYEDPQGDLWIGTLNGGLNRFDLETGRFSHYIADPINPNSLSSNIILDIHPAKDGRLWLGTAGGLILFDPTNGSAVVYDENNGLPNNTVYSVLEDGLGRLWMSTNRGISRFDPISLEFKNFDPSDGMQGYEFNQGAFFQNPSGVMYFGGITGLNVFDPMQIHDSPDPPEVAITNFEIFHRPVAVGPDSPLSQPIEVSRQIKLAHNDDFFEFEFAALHFSSPAENRYAYMLEGLEKDWNYVGSERRFATYTNVPPGNYTFRVRASNSDGVWNDQGASLRIVIPPAFWQTTWFRLLVILAVAGGVFSVSYMRIRSVERQRRQLESLVEQRTRELMLANQRMESELALAAQVQASFMPKDLPSFPGWELSAALVPAKLTSGDFYDVFPLPGERLALLIADVVDKGVGAALFMAMSRTLLRTYTHDHFSEPEHVFREVNRCILEYTSADQFVTVFLGILDVQTGRLVYSNAGHNPPLMIRSTNHRPIQLLKQSGPPLGAVEEGEWLSETIGISTGDTLVLYTDGITEAENERREFYGLDRLVETACRLEQSPADTIREEILSDVERFTGSISPIDDIALMVLRSATDG